MKRVMNIPARISLLMWLVLTVVFAGGTTGQAVFKSAWLLSQQEIPKAREVDEYPNIRFNDEKARLDNFAIELQRDPTAQGYIIGYGGRICHLGEAIARANRARDYMVNTRRIDSSRITTRDGGYRTVVGAELYLRPLGASAPAASPTVRKCTQPQRRR
jgi:hypothetical protein